MLYIMRHGQTDWNILHKLQGHTDIPLNDNGRAMAENAAREYASVPFDICFCSPLCRARETAEILLKGREIPIITDDRLVEMSFGIYEGVENSFQDPDCPINVLFWHPEEYHTPVPQGESLEALFARTGSFLEEVIQPLEEKNRSILIVGHGAMNSSIISRIRNLPLKDFWSAGLENCRLIQLT